MNNFLNLFIAVLLTLILWPVLLITSLIVLLKLGFPIFFIQERVGLNGKIFLLYKFRTMTNKTDQEDALLPDGARLTKVGLFLRKASLDELPQLINIIKGDMNFVGPRPLLVRYLPFYTAEENKRHLVKPGITGLAQISGRNHLDWNTRLRLDVEYVQNKSITLDVKIVCKTVLKVLKGQDVVDNPSELLMDLDIDRKTTK
ncbi:sugar transferase [Paenisporosarcina quisquiliarum]|uniref:sugar transferase n=1 Tax=Paenisporosarcina quisquiliarum TaxID=365346 RepID=UPI0037361553